MSETDKLKCELYDEVVNEKNKQYIELACRFRETCNDIKKKDKEIERLNNIIKEVRECIEPIVELDNDITLKGRVLKPVLEMLDKVDKEK